MLGTYAAAASERLQQQTTTPGPVAHVRRLLTAQRLAQCSTSLATGTDYTMPTPKLASGKRLWCARLRPRGPYCHRGSGVTLASALRGVQRTELGLFGKATLRGTRRVPRQTCPNPPLPKRCSTT